MLLPWESELGEVRRGADRLFIPQEDPTGGGPRPWCSRQSMILRIWAGSVMTAMTDIRDPHRGQASTSIAWTLAGSRAQALRRQSASTSRSIGVSEDAGSAVAFLPYQLAGARELRATWLFHVPRPRDE